MSEKNCLREKLKSYVPSVHFGPSRCPQAQVKFFGLSWEKIAFGLTLHPACVEECPKEDCPRQECPKEDCCGGQSCDECEPCDKGDDCCRVQ